MSSAGSASSSSSSSSSSSPAKSRTLVEFQRLKARWMSLMELPVRHDDRAQFCQRQSSILQEFSSLDQDFSNFSRKHAQYDKEIQEEYVKKLKLKEIAVETFGQLTNPRAASPNPFLLMTIEQLIQARDTALLASLSTVTLKDINMLVEAFRQAPSTEFVEHAIYPLRLLAIKLRNARLAHMLKHFPAQPSTAACMLTPSYTAGGSPSSASAAASSSTATSANGRNPCSVSSSPLSSSSLSISSSSSSNTSALILDPLAVCFENHLRSLGARPLPFSSYILCRRLAKGTIYGYVDYGVHLESSLEVAAKICQKELVFRKVFELQKKESPLHEVHTLRFVNRLRDAPPSSSSSSSSVAHATATAASASPAFFSGQQFICQLLDVREDTSHLWLVLEYFGGGDLFDYSVSSAERQRMCESEAKYYFRQLLEALYYLHRMAGLAHMDVSAENVLLDTPRTNAFLCDFGVGLMLDQSNAKTDGSDPRFLEKKVKFVSSTPGKKGYMSPELALLHECYPTLNDCYCAGILLFLMLKGRKPYLDPTPNLSQHYQMISQVINNFSPPLSHLLSRLLCPEEKRAAIEEILMHEWLKEERWAAIERKDDLSVYLHMKARGYPVDKDYHEQKKPSLQLAAADAQRPTRVASKGHGKANGTNGNLKSGKAEKSRSVNTFLQTAFASSETSDARFGGDK